MPIEFKIFRTKIDIRKTRLEGVLLNLWLILKNIIHFNLYFKGVIDFYLLRRKIFKKEKN